MANQTLTFTLEGRDRLSRILDNAGNSAFDMKTKLLAATAAIPAAAAMAPFIAQTGAAAVAVAAFGAAIVPQVMALGDASEAQKKYEDAVEKSGARSEAAITAQSAYAKEMGKLPPATRQAAVGLSMLKDQYKKWSDSLADDTMPVFTKGLAVAGSLLPKLTPMVKGASVELDRMMTLLGGGMQSPGLDRLSSKFSAFATGSLKKADDAIVHFVRVLDTGAVGGNVAKFMDYARSQGPLVGDTLRNLATAAMHVLQAASETGVGVLTLANAFAKVVSALPPGFISVLLQASLAIRAVRLSMTGVQLAAGAFTLVRAQIAAAGTAAIGTTGAISTLRTAFMAMSLTARTAVAATGIGLLVLGLIKLSSIGKSAPPDVDRLTTSLGNLARTGEVSGEAAKAFGTDLNGLADSLRTLSRPSNLDKTQQFMTSLIGMDSTPFKEAKEDLNAVDDALANLVKGGKAELAKQAFDHVAASMRAQGMSTSELRDKLDAYQSALADQAFEQQMAAQSMGLFGSQAQQVQAKLDAQKQSADGLRQSISALNDAHRQGLGGMIGFEAAIDAATKAIKGNESALSMSGGQLNLNSQKARDAATALNDLAAKTDDAATQARASGASWNAVNAIYARGREKLIAAADAMGLTRGQAKALADQILRTPDKTARLKGNLEDLQAKLASAKSQLAKVPDSRKAAIRAQITDLQNKVAQARAALNSIQSKTVSVMVQYKASKMSPFAKAAGGYASGGKPKPGELAWVGEEGPELMRFGGSGTEIYSHGDSMRMVSDASKAGRDAGLGLRSGMTVSTGALTACGRSMGAAVLLGIRDELEIASPSKKTKALAADAGKGMLIGLTGSKAKISATAKDLVKDIWAAWKGTKSTKDSRLVSMVNRDNAKLQALATKRDALASKIAAARKFASDVTMNARQDAQLSNLGIADDQITAGSIKEGLAQKLAKINTFARYVKLLAAKGLNRGLLQQILNMGPDQGYAYASALLGAGSSSLKAINSLQTQISSSTAALGIAGADAMYDSGAAAGKGFLTGLTSQQRAIEAQMMKIAKGMQAAIKKALGIKSPSRVMAQLGRYSTQGLAVGLTEALPHIDRAMGVVAGRVASGGLGVAMPAVSGGGRGGAGTTVYITIPGLVVDPVGTSKQIVTLLQQYGRNTGMTVSIGGGG